MLAEPTLPPHDRIILFINGSDSRLEEASDLIPKLVRLPNGRPSGYTVITMDLPGSGYASLIDHTEVGPWDPTTADVGIPIGALAPIIGAAFGVPLPPSLSVSALGSRSATPLASISLLPFMEKFIIRFVDALSTRLGGPGSRVVESRLAAVVGGSLGGNLALWLARQPGPWVENVVAWDAGSVWRSLLRPGSLLTSFSSEDPDTKLILAGVSFAIPKADAVETAGSRDDFFAGVFDQGIPPSGQTQPEQWYRDDFWAKSQFIANARLDRRETYTSQFRRWHWRVSLEELMWSWRDTFEQKKFKSRVLLGAGADDDIDPAHIFTNTAQLAVELAKANIDGDTFFFNHTGHSVHAEHPQALADKIMGFLEDSDLRLFTESAVVGTVAFDVIRKDLQNTKPVWQGMWTTGWKNLEIFSMGGKNYVFGYKAGDGTAAFDEIRDDLHNTKGLWTGMWTLGWTSFQIFSMGGKTYLFSYKADTGAVAFDEIPGDLQSTKPVWKGMWTTGWTDLQIFSMGGKNFLFGYKAGNGLAAFDEIPGDLQNTINRWEGKWTTGWTKFEIFSMGGKTFLLRYKAGDGTAEFHEIRSASRNTITRRKAKWTTGWTSFQIFSMGGKTFLLRYKDGNGAVEFLEIRSDLRTKSVWKGKRTPGSTSLQIFPMT